MYPASGISPHPAHLAWAESVGSRVVETPMGMGRFDYGKLEGSDVLLLESLYCAPFARKYKREHPDTRVLCIIADTSFWSERLCILRKAFYKRYLSYVDGFFPVSERIKRDIQSYIDRPAEVTRPFPVNRYRPRKGGFNREILFIGNDAEEKGFGHLVKAMKYLPDFELSLVGTCARKIKTKAPNIHVPGKVNSLDPYFEKCSIYAHPADFDPCPSVVWEAMYAGLIPIISRGVGQHEVFTGGLAKLVLNNNNPKTIARKITEVTELKNKKQIISNCKRVVADYSKPKSIARFKKAFAKLSK